jgi:hypothetical protein
MNTYDRTAAAADSKIIRETSEVNLFFGAELLSLSSKMKLLNAFKWRDCIPLKH